DSKMLFFSKNAQEEETVLLSKRILDEAVELLGSCPRLTKLMVDCSDLELQDVVQKIPQLRHFISRNTHWMPFKLMLDTPAPTSSQLRTVYIAEGVSRGIILSLLTYLPNLERLSVGTRYEEYSQPGGPHMPKSSIPLSLKSRLKGLHFTRRTSNISEHHLLIADILPFVPDLVEIGFPYLDPEIATALAVYCPNLQRFHQTRRPKSIRRGAFTSGVRNSLGILLSSCPNLQEFDGVGHEIEADYLIANPWICRNLQVLRCQIIGLTRLSEKEEINYNQGILFRYRLGYPLSKKESLAVDKHMLEIRPQHTKVYAKLATLVNLRILELGTEYRDLALNTYKTVPSIQRGTEWFIDYGSPAPDTLELSLESGLAQLSTLTKLEVFGLEGVDYRIDEEELRWMAKAWPRLKVISGLQEVEELMRLPHDGEKWYRRVYMQMLRPDVRHERRRVVEPF
ncbi:hypothetical protein EC991_000913, partial [Linnemannia zychae]